MQTANLTGALLDYHVARAEGVPAADLEIRPVQRPDPRTPDTICVRKMTYRNGEPCAVIRIDYSTNWALSGPLVAKLHMMLESNMSDEWAADYFDGNRIQWLRCKGRTPLIAICRAVVRAAFGDEVEDLPCV